MKTVIEKALNKKQDVKKKEIPTLNCRNMDKRNQMENPFFDPDKPGSIFVGMDRYHQYSPHQPRNALTFIQKGDADSLFLQIPD